MKNLSSEADIILWGAGTSRCMRPIWLAEELGVAYSLRPIGPRTGETRTPEYTALNPKQKIPFYVDKDIQLSETVAICRYMIRKFGSDVSLLAPSSLEEQAREDEWLSFIYGELDETSLYVMRRHDALSDIYGESKVAVDSARDYVQRQLAVFEKHLEGKKFLLNSRFSLSDLFLITCLDWVHAYEIPMPPTLEKYRENITQRPAYTKARKINAPT